jgi:hypothetical protein
LEDRGALGEAHAMTPLQWNDPSRTWPLASFEKPERRKPVEQVRNEEPRRGTDAERRKANRRSLRSLLRL